MVYSRYNREIEENYKSIQLQEEQTKKKNRRCTQTIMSSAVIDIQWVLGVNNKYMIKNISIVDTETWATQHRTTRAKKLIKKNFLSIFHNAFKSLINWSLACLSV
ncbi:Uncharacterized protein FWK35_00028475 [Aphis craccivora]|uniref:Uncharacterized protein n=1 Tax=Aphis craccivora TaxID=307492 RepID=A0A6G0YPP6_APHCR|nr:Uncharacterized protein FWK35_00028475 [Aphis craccivora]